MLCSYLRPSLLHILPVRLLSSAASRVAAVKQHELLSDTLAFEDPRAFKVKSLGELLRALGVFRLCSFPVLVNNCGKLMSVARTLLGKRGFSLLLRPTVYAQFVAGENEAEISQSMQKMSLQGLRPMLAVPIEEDLGESTGEKRYDDNMDIMLECVRMSHSNAWSKDPMMQLKITALLSPELCVKLTNVIRQQPYDLNLLIRSMDGEPISFPGLDEKEAAHLRSGLLRLNKIAEASVNKVRVLVDAEYTYMNPALSLVTMAMMKKFNKDGTWIWNTYQCYLKDSRSLLLDVLSLSKNEGFCLGVKLVRGAYMDKERKLAMKEGHQDPIHQSWEDTNDSYNGCLDVMLDVISQEPERYRIIVATHNEESVRRAVKRMEELGIDRDGGSVCFGQLLGMCDHVSLTLAKEGYSVYKSVPYGSVDETLPYLVRRAQENRTVLQGIRKERDLLRKELNRRLRLSLRGGS
ncbi:hydroxyproline dehydrogenase isoform X1 [Oreochromis niloticus]|uniref:hydroxyproline dehydrogenase isoform X1 n=2 Tax=Oreochromis niloticus TaxID=8128 RepID=UPI00022B3480|nr:hydroxyproline dehydrogenase isoform X1 [Oreochromis niloticus]CAI5659014.1 unnamed protein product [Mustela putorius furo]